MPCTDLSPEDVIFGWTHGSTLYSELIQEEVHLEEPKRDGRARMIQIATSSKRYTESVVNVREGTRFFWMIIEATL